MTQDTQEMREDLLESFTAWDLFELDLFLARHPKPLAVDSVIWSRPRGTAVSDKGHLAYLIALLGSNEFGIAKASVAAGGRWGQVLNVADHGEPWACIVEVHDGTARDFAKRVFRGQRSSDYPPSPTGTRPLHDFELFDATTAANIVWAWIHVGLPVGFMRTSHHLDAEELRRYRLV